MSETTTRGRFDGRTCIVTGGARGIGATVAEMYARQGGQVVIGDTNAELGTSLALQIGPQATFVAMDITDAASCQSLVDTALDRCGQVDHVVNGAIRPAAGPLKDLSLADWNAAIAVGLTGTFLMCQAAARWMIEHGRTGAIVNIGSIGGVAPYAQAGAYSTVKAGVAMLGKHMALEWASHGIRVNTIQPGHVHTPLTAYFQDPDIKAARIAATPLKRIGETQDMANGILFLLSDEAAYITATELTVDGGVTASIMNHLPGRKFDAGPASPTGVRHER